MRTTKLELQQALAARNAELETARLRIAELEGDVAALDAKLERATFAIIDSDVARGEMLAEVAQLKARPQLIKVVYAHPERGAPTRSAYVPREPSAEVLERRVLMARAKELAAAGKRVVVRGNELIVSN